MKLQSRVACLFVAVSLPLIAFAGLRVAEKHEGWQLTVGGKVTAHASLDDCKKALLAIGVGASGKCKDVTAVIVEQTCEGEPKPPLPKDTELWSIQVSETEWRVEVTAWVPAPNPVWPSCWVLGRGELKYTNEAEEGAPDLSPGPWVYGADYPVGTACPAAALAGCYVPPNPDVPPP